MAQTSWSLLFCLLITLMITIPKSISAQTFLYNFCSNSSSYAPNSHFKNNLDTLFNSLSSNSINGTGFFSTSAGNGTSNAVYGLFLCRGDQSTSACSNCVATAVKDQPKTTTCPRSKEEILWYDECMVRYSDKSIFGKMDQLPTLSMFNTQNITGNQTLFSELLGSTLPSLMVQAANNQTGEKFARRTVMYTSLQNLYTMVQCTPDSTPSDCNQCLTIAVGQLTVKQGGRVLQPSCNVRYETYPFLEGNNDLATAPMSSPLQPPPATNSTTRSLAVSPPRGKKKTSTKAIVALVVSTVVVSVTLLAVGIYCIKKKPKNYDVAHAETGNDFSTVESLQYDFAALQSATNNFSDENKLGEGGFRCVYKGTMSNGQEIAVKRLSTSSSQGVQEFKSEVLLVAKLQHMNLARLLGFCLTGQEKILVYEYVPNKSLDNFLFDHENHAQLDWATRYRIVMGIARGMMYLHHDSQLRIIHRDLKTSNILLDADMNPKIADFGMARIFRVDQTQGNTSRVIGTYGYMSPEYGMHGQFSAKSDVYSFGVLILEIISGKRNSSFYQSDEAETF